MEFVDGRWQRSTTGKYCTAFWLDAWCLVDGIDTLHGLANVDVVLFLALGFIDG